MELEQQIDLRVSLSTISVLLVPLLRQAIFSVPDEEVLYGRSVLNLNVMIGCLSSVQISCNNNEMMMQLSAVMHDMHHVPDSLAAKNNTTQHTDTAFTSSQCQDRSAIIVLHSLDRRVGRFNQEMEMEEKERID